MANPDGSFVSGALSVRAALSGGKREVYEVFCAPIKKTGLHAPKDALVVAELARVKKIPVKAPDDALFAGHPDFQNAAIVARVGKRIADDKEKLLASANFLACLYGIEDPYNLGDAIRSLYAAGCDGVFLPKRDLESATDILIRASAGASELIDLCELYGDPDDFLSDLVKNGITPIEARETRATALSDTLFPKRFCLLIGGEKRGVAKTLSAKIETGVKIEYARNFSRSLSASAATAAIAFAAANQRKANGQ